MILAGHQGDAATIRRHLADPDPGVRAAALSALARASAIEPSDVIAGLEDASPLVRGRALEIAATNIVAVDVEALITRLADTDPRVVETASWSLGEIEPPAVVAVESLCRLVSDHDDALVREAAVAALGAIGAPEALDTILAATTDIATVRRRAVIALAPFDGPEVDAALERACADRDWQVRQAAEDLLAPPGVSDPEHP